MAKKKSQAKVTKAEAYYIESHYGTKTAAELSSDLGLPAEVVNDYLSKLEEAGFQSPVAEAKAEVSGVEKAGFGIHEPKDDEGNPAASISVVMTKAASEQGDEFHKQKRKGGGVFCSKKNKNCIHVIDPKRPVR